MGDHLRQGFWPALPAAQDWSPVCGQDTGHPPSIWGLAVPCPSPDGWAPGNRGTCEHANKSSSYPEQPRSIGGHLAGTTVNRWSPSTCFYPRVIVTTKPHPDRLRDPGSVSVWWKRRKAPHVSQALVPGRVPGRHRRGRDLARPKAPYGFGPTGRGVSSHPGAGPRGKRAARRPPAPAQTPAGPAPAPSAPHKGGRGFRVAGPARARRPRGLGPGAEGRASRRPQRRPPARPRGAPRAPHLPPAPAARLQRRASRPGRRRRRRPPEGPRGRSSNAANLSE